MWRASEASAYVKAPRQAVFSVLRSYELYRAWVPDVVDSALFAREGDVAMVQLVCPRYSPEKFLLELIETPEQSITFRRVDRDRLELTGRWDLEEADGGDSVVARVSLRLATAPHRILARRAMGEILERTVEALKTRCLRLVTDGARGEVLLDLELREGEVQMRLGERSYALTRAAETE